MTNNVEPTEEEKENAKTISLDGMGVLPSNEDELTRYGKRELKNLTSVISQALAEQRGLYEKEIQDWKARLTTTSIYLEIERSLREIYENDFHTLKERIQYLVKAGDILRNRVELFSHTHHGGACISPEVCASGKGICYWHICQNSCDAWDKAKGEK